MTQRGEAWVQQAQSDLAVAPLTAEGVHAEASNQAWQGVEAMGCRAWMVRRRALPAPPLVGPCRIRTSRLTKPSPLISHQFTSGVFLRGQRA
jgi:hypothetical protein